MVCFVTTSFSFLFLLLLSSSWLNLGLVAAATASDSYYPSSSKKCVDTWANNNENANRMDLEHSVMICRVEQMLEKLHGILNQTKSRSTIQLANEQEHTYNDKYSLVEFVTHQTWASLQHALNLLLADGTSVFQDLHKDGNDVANDVEGKKDDFGGGLGFLNFFGKTDCQVISEQEVNVQMGEAVEVTKDGETAKTTYRKTHKVTEYTWNVTFLYEFSLCSSSDSCGTTVPRETNESNNKNDDLTTGTTTSRRKTLKKRQWSITVKTTTKNPPPIRPQVVAPPSVDIRWLLRHGGNHTKTSSQQVFKIDRNVESCKTPRRNEDMERVLYQYHRPLHTWFTRIERNFFRQILVDYQKMSVDSSRSNHPRDLSWILGIGDNLDDDHDLWYPAAPLLENSTVLTASRVALLHRREQQGLARLLEEAYQRYAAPAPDIGRETQTKEEGQADGGNNNTAIISAQEASMLILLRHLRATLQIHKASVDFVETMLRNQLVAAIGKEIDVADFRQYMKFYSHKFLSSAVVSIQPCSMAIRHGSDSTPVGSFAIEEETTTRFEFDVGSQPQQQQDQEPIQLLTRRLPGQGQPPINIPIDAATRVQMRGDRILSGWIRYEFGKASDENHDSAFIADAPKTTRTATTLTARARQFSSFILLIGTITGPESFDPKNAMILKNKDNILIPLLTETLPSAKEFKDAISSLSTEQQQFARAFRAMQLESSVFGLCVIPLKPQLEVLLNLEAGSLAKEIKLTEDLTTLFVDHHIPADLLSFDGDASWNATAKVALVKEYVQAVMSVIENAKQQILEEEKEKAKAKHYMDSRKYKHMRQGDVMMDENDDDDMIMEMQATADDMVMDAPPPQPLRATASFGSAGATSSAARHRTLRTAHATTSLRQMSASHPPPEDASFAAAKEEPEGMESSDDESQQPRRGEDLRADSFESDPSIKGIDFTKIPKKLDAKLEQQDSDGYLRPMIIKPRVDQWSLKRKDNLLVDPKTLFLSSTEVVSERQKAFDLLDAISKSGNLPIDAAQLYVVIGVTHNFVSSLLETLYKDNINPILKAEKSLLLLASQIFDKAPRELLRHKADLTRLTALFPDLVVQ